MHLIYVDESGDDGFSANGTYPIGTTPPQYFVRAGLIVHDWKWRAINNDFENFKYSKSIPKDVEIHATEMMYGRYKRHDPQSKKRLSVPNWFGKKMPDKEDRKKLLIEICNKICALDVCLICIAIDKSKIKLTHPNYKAMPKEKSWEFLLERVNLFLDHAQDKKGLIISDAIEFNLEKKHRTFARALLAQSVFIKEYHFVESILFEPSDSSNMLQLADVVAYAYGRKMNFNDDTYSKCLDGKLLHNNGNVQGAGFKVWPE